MVRKTGFIVLIVMLIACTPRIQPESVVAPADTSSTLTYRGDDGRLLPNSLRVKFDVDADGRVQNIQIQESTVTLEVQEKVVSAMKKWRYEKGKPAVGLKAIIIPKGRQFSKK